MSTEKHFNEKGVLPEVLEDRRPHDRKAARAILYVVLATGSLTAIVLLLMRAL